MQGAWKERILAEGRRFIVLEWKQAIESLKAASLQPVHILVGTDYILFRWYIDAMRKQCENAAGMEFEVEKYRFEEEGCSGAMLACQTVSLFSQTGLVLLDGCSALLTGSKAKQDTSDLEAYLASPVEGKVLVITAYGEKMDERKKLVKLAKGHALVDCSPPKDAVALQWLRDYCAEQQCSISPKALEEVWRRTLSMTAAVMELDKLSTYSAGKQIELEAVQELVSLPLEDNVFSFIDGVVKGDIAKSFRVLGDVQRAGYDVFALYALIARQLRLMWYGKVLGAKGYSNQQIATRAGAHPYAVKVAMDQAKSMQQKQIERLLTVLADGEFAVKSGRRDANHSLDWVLMACSAAR